MVERFQILLRELKLSAAEFAGRIGVQRSSMSHVMSGRNKPSIDFLEKIIRAFPEVDPRWLITGEGEWKNEKSDRDGIGEISVDRALADVQDDRATEQPDAPAGSAGGRQAHKEIPARLENRPVRQIIVVYDDDTFSVLVPRRTNH